MEQGCAALYNALSNPKMQIGIIAAEGNEVIVMFHYDVQHNETFVREPSTKKRVQ